MIKVGDKVKVKDLDGEHLGLYDRVKRNEVRKVVEVKPCNNKQTCQSFGLGECQGSYIFLENTRQYDDGCWGYGGIYGITKSEDKYDKLVENMKNA